jgi:ergothioneine biosynthesis protein EgtB
MVAPAPELTRDSLAQSFSRIRERTDALTAPLSAEDQQVQSMPACSPTKWHRAHTTWFFETFVLARLGVAPVDPRFGFLFNSYYESVGDRVARPLRGMQTRPSVAEIGEYRRRVDETTSQVLRTCSDEAFAGVAPIVELGLMHEEQHQELILTDVLHAFSLNPTSPVYRQPGVLPEHAATEQTRPAWRSFEGGLVAIGAPETGFAFDNERPRHKVYLVPFELRSQPITVGEVKGFVEDAGYATPALWLSDGFAWVREHGIRAPGYTHVEPGSLRVFTLRGWHTPADDEPASHLSFWEAEAIARWLRARLPTEAEWEHACEISEGRLAPPGANLLEGPLLPIAGARSLFGDVWQWTRSSYEPYPGFRIADGALGEYNGKFMAQQLVLRGGSCLTPRGHVRASYRNFWPPETRFQMTGARIAR